MLTQTVDPGYVQEDRGSFRIFWIWISRIASLCIGFPTLCVRGRWEEKEKFRLNHLAWSTKKSNHVPNSAKAVLFLNEWLKETKTFLSQVWHCFSLSGKRTLPSSFRELHDVCNHANTEISYRKQTDAKDCQIVIWHFNFEVDQTGWHFPAQKEKGRRKVIHSPYLFTAVSTSVLGVCLQTCSNLVILRVRFCTLWCGLLMPHTVW